MLSALLQRHGGILRAIIITIGKATKGMCPKNCIRRRLVTEGGRKHRDRILTERLSTGERTPESYFMSGRIASSSLVWRVQLGAFSGKPLAGGPYP
jgi:hypothetical protein